MFNKILRSVFGAAIGLSLIALTGCNAASSSSATDLAKKKVAVTTGNGNASAPTSTTTATVATTTTTSSPLVSLNGLAGLADIADNFDTATGLEPSYLPTATSSRGGPPIPTGQSEGDFRFSCLSGQLLKDDPLLLPGQPGASHLHQFWGNTGANANSTYQSLRTSGQSTCSDPNNGPVNRTAYWMPAMLDGAGNVVKPDYITVYYKSQPTGSAGCHVYAPANGDCVPLPNGIRYTFGYNMNTGLGGPDDSTSPGFGMNRYACWTAGTGFLGQPLLGGQTYHTIDDIVAAGCPAGAELTIAYVAPACWDGKTLDAADHRSNVVYSTVPIPGVGYGCPSDHPYLLPNFSGFLVFTTDANFAAGKWRLSSDDMASQMLGHRVPAGSTLHFDYFEGWSPAVKATWDKYCIQASMNCSENDLGNGTGIRLGDTGSNEAMASHLHVLVPLSTLP